MVNRNSHPPEVRASMARLIRVLLVWAALIFILYTIRVTLFHDAQQQVRIIFKPAAMLLSSAAFMAFGLIAINDVKQGMIEDGTAKNKSFAKLPPPSSLFAIILLKNIPAFLFLLVLVNVPVKEMIF